MLQEAIAELEKRQAKTEAEKHKTAIKDNAEALFNSPRHVSIGNPKGDVTFVEFFDYNCGYCKRAMTDMMTLMKADPNLKVVLKEFPVLGPGSQDAAKVGVAVRMQDKTGKKYLEFHQKLHDRARPDRQGPRACRRQGGWPRRGAHRARSRRRRGARRASRRASSSPRSSGVNGTPGYVIGNDVVVGAVGVEALREKINNARCGKATC